MKRDTQEHRVFDDQAVRDKRGIENAVRLFRGLLDGTVKAPCGAGSKWSSPARRPRVRDSQKSPEAS